jgi:hypothetical protein
MGLGTSFLTLQRNRVFQLSYDNFTARDFGDLIGDIHSDVNR